jgi:peptidyl-prolyl cis-trans isomerase B (cyclophilin B)
MLPPPDRTLAGLSTGKIHDQVVQLWPQIRFVNAAGKPISYVADVEIENYGTIELLMRPDLAPNHVRNFVALATLQYYDGLRIDRLIRQQSDEDPNNKLTLLEAGSPTESAEPEIAHLGYWLKPEFTDAAKHEPGSVGACLHMSADMMSLNPESAACRFYITLTPAPAMDGNYAVFAKVSRGLELLQQLATKPTRTDPGPDFGKPTNPIVIRKITVRVVDVVE